MSPEAEMPPDQQFVHLLEQLVAVQREIAQTQEQLAVTQGQLATMLAHLAALYGPSPDRQSLAEEMYTIADSTEPPVRAGSPAPPAYHPKPLTLIFERDEQQRVMLEPNGIDGMTGEPLLRLDATAAQAMAEHDPEPQRLEHLHKEKSNTRKTHLGTLQDAQKLHETLWAVVVHSAEDATVLKALSPLIAHRSTLAGLTPPELTFRNKETCGAWLARHVTDLNAPLKSGVPVLIYHHDEPCTAWLARHGASHGVVDARRGVPYYLLLIGRPGPRNDKDTIFIPFDFQYELDMFWAVGRLCFNDLGGQHDLADYTAYAEQVVAFEQSMPAYKKHVVFFGTRHDLDTSTERSAEELVRPLANGFGDHPGVAQANGYTAKLLLQNQATHATLGQILRGELDGGPPALLFTATHGIGLPAQHPDLVQYQGALVCQDWEGYGSIKREHWFAAEDLTEQTRIAGLIAVCFACYGVGCPAIDQFIFDPNKQRPAIAPYPLIAQLPQRLLTRGALAVLGHVDRAWTHSFSGPNVTSQTQMFEDVIGGILKGKRVGDALDQFNLRQGVLAMQLAEELYNITFGKRVNPAALAPLWVARNDARNYILLGDPAVRLPVEQTQSDG